jgi:predicted amidohydrolase
MASEHEPALTVSLIQYDIKWEDITHNLRTIDHLLATSQSSDLYVLPETFATGFTMKARMYAEEESGPTVQWMKEKARTLNAVITGSTIIKDGNHVYNRLLWISPQGIQGSYDKRHLFRIGGEHENYTPGKSRVTFSLKGFRILPLICYDLRFPVFSRNKNDYDVLMFVANWPAPRQKVWNTLLKARAIENQCYVLGVSRVGKDGDGTDHEGGSAVIDPYGQIKATLGNAPGVLNYDIHLSEIRDFRKKFPVWKDADDFTIQL